MACAAFHDVGGGWYWAVPEAPPLPTFVADPYGTEVAPVLEVRCVADILGGGIWGGVVVTVVAVGVFRGGSPAAARAAACICAARAACAACNCAIADDWDGAGTAATGADCGAPIRDAMEVKSLPLGLLETTAAWDDA